MRPGAWCHPCRPPHAGRPSGRSPDAANGSNSLEVGAGKPAGRDSDDCALQTKAQPRKGTSCGHSPLPRSCPPRRRAPIPGNDDAVELQAALRRAGLGVDAGGQSSTCAPHANPPCLSASATEVGVGQVDVLASRPIFTGSRASAQATSPSSRRVTAHAENDTRRSRDLPRGARAAPRRGSASTHDTMPSSARHRAGRSSPSAFRIGRSERRDEHPGWMPAAQLVTGLRDGLLSLDSPMNGTSVTCACDTFRARHLCGTVGSLRTAGSRCRRPCHRSR